MKRAVPAFLILLLLATELGLHVGGTTMIVIYSCAMMLVTCAGSALHAVAAWRSRGRARTVWSTTAVGLACWAYAEISVGVPAVQTGIADGRGTLATIFNLGALVLAVVAMLTIPTAPRTAVGKVRMVLDGTVAASALLGTAWMLVLAPMIKVSGGLSNAVVDLAYPVAAVALLAISLVLLAAQPARRATAMSAISGGIVVLTATLLVEVVGQVLDQGWLRPWVLGGYVAAAALMSVAPLVPLPARQETPTARTAASPVLPYAPVAVYVVVVAAQTTSGHALDPEVVWAALLMVVAVLGRQFLALRANAALSRDLAAQRERFAYDAAHDSLTGLANRAGLQSALETVRENASLLLIDLDDFKIVNDTLGHAAGDDLLRLTADRIRQVTADHGEDAFPVRLGGDEFAVLLHSGGAVRGSEVAAAIVERLGEPTQLHGRRTAVRASIGVAPAAPGSDAQSLLRDADIALYQAKELDKGGWRLYDEQLDATIQARRSLRDELAHALRSGGRLRLEFQPIVDLATGAVVSSEALVRWDRPGHGTVAPGDFLPVAHEAGLMPALDRWVLTTALAATPSAAAVPVHVNVSAEYLAGGTVLDDIRRALADTGRPPSALTLEVTETALIGNLDATAQLLQSVRDLGVRVVLDDFGVGYSSLTYLRRLPVDGLKIDRSFIQELHRDREATVLIQTIMTLIHGLGLDCVAEGVETEAQAAALRELGCPQAQGFLYGHPAPAAELVRQA
ncbi:bifunctional diguanylate cyclase/phosphodiesterase [Actinoplanes sp. LDG1-06]|uniref:Bifunctional diguanylate cyclase/phosphodiesterase n=1 Tax=Paractinoplanes ovalisporus TaxID=2810368 RepID=A0ABS2AXD9_9ACTN|nr:bifunctional diguanylate cyclase/phosphodiesterase [Actinoplanes ovalisporus]MBM2623901.1 bifunctional diguanylate cyclase/phosphodiesterase [Actinoplanes ovalisporus]